MKHPFFDSSLKSGIYVITCVPVQKHYVGESGSVNARLTAHKSHLRRGIHPNTQLQEDFKRYTEKAFVFQKLLFGCGACKTQREILETHILVTLPENMRYNAYINWRKRGATRNPFFGKKHTLEARQAQSAEKQNKPSGFTGHKQANRVKLLVSQANKGKSDRRKPLFIDDVFYESITEASTMTQLNRRIIRERCNSVEPRFQNYRWKTENQNQS